MVAVAVVVGGGGGRNREGGCVRNARREEQAGCTKEREREDRVDSGQDWGRGRGMCGGSRLFSLCLGGALPASSKSKSNTSNRQALNTAGLPPRPREGYRTAPTDHLPAHMLLHHTGPRSHVRLFRPPSTQPIAGPMPLKLQGWLASARRLSAQVSCLPVRHPEMLPVILAVLTSQSRWTV